MRAWTRAALSSETGREMSEPTLSGETSSSTRRIRPGFAASTSRSRIASWSNVVAAVLKLRRPGMRAGSSASFVCESPHTTVVSPSASGSART